MKRRPTGAPVKRYNYEIETQGQRGRGRPRKTWKETQRKGLDYLDLTKEMVQNREQ